MPDTLLLSAIILMQMRQGAQGAEVLGKINQLAAHAAKEIQASLGSKKVMFKTLAERTSLVAAVTRDAISAWNGMAVLRQSPNRTAEPGPARG